MVIYIRVPAHNLMKKLHIPNITQFIHYAVMKIILFVLLSIISVNSFALSYPKSPDPDLTPGSLCDTPDRYRHPQQIPYCERNVNSFLKELIFVNYRKLGYSLSGDRSGYKVDHFIPLCFGGSNKPDNLWPQHASLSVMTDSLEAMGCEVLGLGKATQIELLDLIIKAKLNTKEAPKIFKYLKSLKNR